MNTKNKLDLSEYSTAAGQAKAVHRELQDIAKSMGINPEEISIHRPEDARALRGLRYDAWLVSWEGGPIEWAVWLTGGESLFWGEYSEHCTKGNPEIEGFNENPGVLAEPYYSFDILFTNQ